MPQASRSLVVDKLQPKGSGGKVLGATHCLLALIVHFVCLAINELVSRWDWEVADCVFLGDARTHVPFFRNVLSALSGSGLTACWL